MKDMEHTNEKKSSLLINVKLWDMVEILSHKQHWALKNIAAAALLYFVRLPERDQWQLLQNYARFQTSSVDKSGNVIKTKQSFFIEESLWEEALNQVKLNDWSMQQVMAAALLEMVSLRPTDQERIFHQSQEYRSTPL